MVILVSMLVILSGYLLIQNKDYIKYGIIKAIYRHYVGNDPYWMNRINGIRKRNNILTYRARIRVMKRYILSNRSTKSEDLNGANRNT